MAWCAYALYPALPSMLGLFLPHVSPFISSLPSSAYAVSSPSALRYGPWPLNCLLFSTAFFSYAICF
eukprot:365255-Chlamydomonas_euryale.AAC.8